jgi:hypothetical protein
LKSQQLDYKTAVAMKLAKKTNIFTAEMNEK